MSSSDALARPRDTLGLRQHVPADPLLIEYSHPWSSPVNHAQTNTDISNLIAAFGAELYDRAQPFGLLVRFEVRKGTEDEVINAFQAARTPTSQEAGVLTFELHQEGRTPSQFVVYERWRSLADLDAHLRTSYITALRACLDRLIVGAPEFRVLNPR